MIASVLIPRTAYEHIIAHAEGDFPLEACGLLTGSANGKEIVITGVVKSTNLAPNPAAAFVIDPAMHIQLQKQLRSTHASIIGIYHSHPKGEAVLSALDKENAVDTPLLWMVIALHPQQATTVRCYLFLLEEQKFSEITIHVY